MRRITLVSLLASLLLLLTACGNPVAVKLHENGSGFNATVTCTGKLAIKPIQSK